MNDPVLARPAVFFKNVLDLDQFARVFGDVETNRIGGGCRGKLFATVAAIAKIANLPGARFVRLRGISRRAALTRKSITER